MKPCKAIICLLLFLTALSSRTYAQKDEIEISFGDIENAIIHARFDEMSSYVDHIVNLLPDIPKSNTKDLISLNESLGYLYLHLGRPEKALDAFNKCWILLLKHNPTNILMRHRIIFGLLTSSTKTIDDFSTYIAYIGDNTEKYHYYANLGLFIRPTQDYGLVIETLTKAADLCHKEASEHIRWAALNYLMILDIMADIQMEAGEYDKALTLRNDFQNMLRSRSGPDTYYDIRSELEKTRIYMLLGNMQMARESAENTARSLAVSADGNTHFDASLTEIRGDICFEEKDYQSADSLYKKTRDFDCISYRKGTLLMIKQMTCNFRMGRKEHAEFLSDLIEIRREGNEDVELFTEHITQYGESMADTEFNSLSIDFLKTGLDLMSNFGDYDSQLKLRNTLGVVYIRSGDYASATDLYASVIIDEKKRAHDIFAFLPEGQRELYWKMKEPLMKNIFKLNQEGTITVSRGTVFENRKGNRNLCSSVLYDASLLNKGLLLEAFLNMQRTILASGDEELIDAFTELRRLKGTDPQRAEELEQTIISRTKSYGDYMDFTRIGWQDVRDNLLAHEAAVEFVVSEKNEMSYYSAEILRAGYSEPQHVFLFAHRNEDNSLLGMDVYSTPALYKKTWGKMTPYLEGCTDIYFAPAGDFYGIGMEYLPVNDSLRINDLYNMHRLSSTKSLADRTDDPNLGQPSSAALYGGLDYNLDNESMEYYAYTIRSESRGSSSSVNLSNTRSLEGLNWGYLRGTAEEVRNITEILKSKDCRTDVYTDGEGVEESFKILTGNSPEIIHIATHGFFFQPSNDISLSTGLVFAGANNYGKAGAKVSEGIDDGLLTSKEIAEMNLTGAELVVLSACQTGLGQISGEGVFGLQRGFKKACAQTLLMSLWEVDDRATNELMTDFYTHLASGKDKHTALHLAQEHVMSVCGSDPRLWAGFILLD